MVENLDLPGNGRFVKQFAGATVQGVSEEEVKPNGTIPCESDIAAGRDKFLHPCFVSGQIGEFGRAGGGVEIGEIEDHKWAAVRTLANERS